MSDDDPNPISAEDLTFALMDSGYRAELEKLEDGRKYILSSASGWKFGLYLFELDDTPDVVDSIMFSFIASRDVTLDQVNTWNRERRFGRAFLDEEGLLNVEWDCMMTHGNLAYFRECVEVWDRLLGRIDEFEKVS
ncbi:MAG: YbjN domain-containing protein [Pseudomonadota bacterium]